MTEKKIKFPIRLLLISLCAVLLLSAMCGAAAADRYVYVPSCPPTGDSNVSTADLKTALESQDYDIVVLTENVSLSSDVNIVGTKTLISYYPEGMTVDAEGNDIYVPVGNSLTLGTGVNDVNIKGGTGNYLFKVYGTLTMLDDVNIYGNTARKGVIVVDGVSGKFTMNGGRIYNNAATIGTVYAIRGDFIMDGGNISENTNNIAGGVTVGSSGKFKMGGGNIVSNTGKTGGVYIKNGGYFELNGGTIANNTASESGGGVFVANGGNFIQSSGDIERNKAEYDGGAVYLFATDAGTAEYRMSGGTLNNNTAKRNGGGVYQGTHYISSDFTLSGGTIADNKAKTGGGVYLSDYGGPFYNNSYGEYYAEGAKFTMSGGKIINNIADNTGGVFVGGKQEKMPEARYKFVQTVFSMSGGSIINNTGTPVNVSAGKFVMSDGSITGNNNETLPVIHVMDSTDKDPTLHVLHQGVFEMSDGSIYDNLGNHSYVYNNKGAVFISGGDIYYTGVNNSTTGIENYGDLEIIGDALITGFTNHGVNNSNNFSMSGGTIFANEADYGGGIYNSGNFTLSGTGNIYNNTAHINGGGIYTANTLLMSGGSVSSNTARDYGGGIFSNSSVTMSGGAISGNHADYGGAVMFKDYFDMAGGTISGNSAKSGGALYLTNITNTTTLFNMYGGTISGNTADDKSGIYFTSGNFSLGNAGYVNGNNNVVIGKQQRINVVSNLTGGVFSIVPVTDSPQTVVTISVPGLNASYFMGNFNLGSSYSSSAYYNNLAPSKSTIVIGHVSTPTSPVYLPSDGQYTGNIYCSVTFDPMNGSNATIVPVVFGATVAKPEDPTNGLADFLGWYTAFDYEWNFANDTVETPVILYAHWYGEPYPKQVAVPASEGGVDIQIPTLAIVGVIAGVLIAAAVVTFIVIRRRRDSE